MRQTEFFVISGHFLSFYPTNNLENQNFEKMKEASGDVIILHMRTKNKSRSYDVRSLRYIAQQKEFFVILGHFLPIYPTNNLKNQNFEKMKKTPGDIIILHICTINENHMMYGS